MIIALNQKERQIWQDSLDDKRRNMIRKAQRHNIEIEAQTPQNLKSFYSLFTEAFLAKGPKPKPLEFYLKLFERCYPKDKAVIFTAKKNGEFLSAVMLLRNSHICHYWIGFTKPGAQNLGQSELLQWEAIRWAKRLGSSYYDLCVIEPHRLGGIARFKLGFSRNRVPFYLYNSVALPRRILRRLSNGCSKILCPE